MDMLQPDTTHGRLKTRFGILKNLRNQFTYRHSCQSSSSIKKISGREVANHTPKITPREDRLSS